MRLIPLLALAQPEAFVRKQLLIRRRVGHFGEVERRPRVADPRRAVGLLRRLVERRQTARGRGRRGSPARSPSPCRGSRRRDESCAPPRTLRRPAPAPPARTPAARPCLGQRPAQRFAATAIHAFSPARPRGPDTRPPRCRGSSRRCRSPRRAVPAPRARAPPPAARAAESSSSGTRDGSRDRCRASAPRRPSHLERTPGDARAESGTGPSRCAVRRARRHAPRPTAWTGCPADAADRA